MGSAPMAPRPGLHSPGACAPLLRKCDGNGCLLPLAAVFRPSAFPPSQPDVGKASGEHAIETFNCSG
eukprot:9047909-Pyramimonas_sp.AAC.1